MCTDVTFTLNQLLLYKQKEQKVGTKKVKHYYLS